MLLRFTDLTAYIAFCRSVEQRSCCREKKKRGGEMGGGWDGGKERGGEGKGRGGGRKGM